MSLWIWSLDLKMVRRGGIRGFLGGNVLDGDLRRKGWKKGYPFAGMIRIRFHGSGAAAPLSAMTSTAPRTIVSMDSEPVVAKRKVIESSQSSQDLGPCVSGYPPLMHTDAGNRLEAPRIRSGRRYETLGQERSHKESGINHGPTGIRCHG
jgi:hypothetical protein